MIITLLSKTKQKPMEHCFYFQKPQVPSNASTTKECKLSEKYRLSDGSDFNTL